MPNVEQITEPVADHGEGPVWSAAWGGLRWVDMLAGDLLTLDEDGTVHRQSVGTVAAAVRPRTSGGFVAAVERGFALADEPDAPVRVLPELWSDSGLRMNEGACGPDGAFYCGSMAYDASPGRGSLHRLDPDGSVTTTLTGCTISNGLAWSPDGSTAYYTDTATQRIDAFDFSPADGLTNQRPVVRIDETLGSPDGLTVDAEGGLWTALWTGGAVHRYSPDGHLEQVIEIPVRQVTACTFGGDDLSQLFVTTSRYGLDPKSEPAAGAVFATFPGVRGLPTAEYAG